MNGPRPNKLIMTTSLKMLGDKKTCTKLYRTEFFCGVAETGSNVSGTRSLNFRNTHGVLCWLVYSCIVANKPNLQRPSSSSVLFMGQYKKYTPSTPSIPCDEYSCCMSLHDVYLRLLLTAQMWSTDKPADSHFFPKRNSNR